MMHIRIVVIFTGLYYLHTHYFQLFLALLPVPISAISPEPNNHMAAGRGTLSNAEPDNKLRSALVYVQNLLEQHNAVSPSNRLKFQFDDANKLTPLELLILSISGIPRMMS